MSAVIVPAELVDNVAPCTTTFPARATILVEVLFPNKPTSYPKADRVIFPEAARKNPPPVDVSDGPPAPMYMPYVELL